MRVLIHMIEDTARHAGHVGIGRELVDGTIGVLDIEGTLGSLTYVREVLFPYAREQFAEWFVDNRGSPWRAALLAAIRTHVRGPSLDETGAVAALVAWTDDDVKTQSLKEAQARIWAGAMRRARYKGMSMTRSPSCSPAGRNRGSSGTSTHPVLWPPSAIGSGTAATVT